MRTLIDIPNEDLAQIRKITEEQGISRAEYVRRVIKDSLEPAQKKDMSEFFGLWSKGRGVDETFEDGVAYQQRLRAEWD